MDSEARRNGRWGDIWNILSWAVLVASIALQAGVLVARVEGLSRDIARLERRVERLEEWLPSGAR